MYGTHLTPIPRYATVPCLPAVIERESSWVGNRERTGIAIGPLGKASGEEYKSTHSISDQQRMIVFRRLFDGVYFKLQSLWQIARFG